MQACALLPGRAPAIRWKSAVGSGLLTECRTWPANLPIRDVAVLEVLHSVEVLRPKCRLPPLAGQVGSPKPCVTTPRTEASAVPAGASHWEVVDGLLMACGEPTGYLTSDNSYKNFMVSFEKVAR